jgi:DNA helicase-2/ATP-dependent DNA helicase PcrA
MIDKSNGGFPNPEQQKIIDKLDGSLLVLAPAGTGKTRVMASRLAATIGNGVDADRTLGVTFTNRAAGQMKAQVDHQLGSAARRTNIRTFHGLCAWMLRHEAKDLGLPRDYVIYDEEDSKEVLRYCLRETSIKPQDAYWEISKLKSGCLGESLSLSAVTQLDVQWSVPELATAAAEYHRLLAERHALDFTDLVYRARAMLALLPDKREKWSRRFDWIQVDEVQDTHFSEYEIIHQLAVRTRNLAMFGDIDQTIYEWRGSDPDSVLGLFRRDFTPVQEFSLVDNYRATRKLLEVADKFASTFKNRLTHIRPAPGLPAGEFPTFERAGRPSEEAEWIAEQSSRLKQSGDARTAVLTRTHRRSQAVSDAMHAAGVPHVTVEQFEFFRRQEIKDVLARMRLILNPHDTGALGRVTRRPASGIGKATLRTLWQEGEPAGLRLTDLIKPETHQSGEPFGPLLANLNRGVVVVLDVETTGLSSLEDEVVDVGAVRIVDGAIEERFEALIRPTRPVGQSFFVHGLSDAVLQDKGQDPVEVFQQLRGFVAGARVVGHNVRFDLSMLKAHSDRVGSKIEFRSWDDTLEIGRRLLNLERYDLATMSRHLNTPHHPSHRALADVEATAEVLLQLRGKLEAGQGSRRLLVDRLGKPFEQLAELFASWGKAADELRPADLCRMIVDQSGLAGHYFDDVRRSGHIEELVLFFADNDDENASPRSALEELVQKASLARNVDHLSEDDPRILVLTIHQAKGLEFDTVFVAGVSKGEIPSFFAERDGKVEEERRLFYVAITRAKRQLFLSCFDINDNGYTAGPSQFMQDLWLSIHG